MDLIVGVVLVLGLMIMIHELGHFIVARLFGVRVDVFSIGFGPRLFGWKHGATDYRVSALPFGGYVRMAGQDMSEVDSGAKAPTGSPDELMSKPRWQRALISLAGPSVNLIFPIFLLTAYFLVKGVPFPAFYSQPIQIAGLPASANDNPQSLHNGDRVVTLNGVVNPTWQQADQALSKTTEGGQLNLEVENAGVRRTVVISLKPGETHERILGYVPIPPVIDVEQGTPAAHAHLQEGDVVKAIDGQKIAYWEELVDHVRASGGKPLELDVERNGQLIHTTVTPQRGAVDPTAANYQIGVGSNSEAAYRKVGLAGSVSEASAKTFQIMGETLGVVGKLISGRVSVKQLRGAVGISRAAGAAVHKGASAVISLMVLITVNLGILNLLPIPILDGGNILLLAIEGGMRRDLSMAFKERFVQVGFVFLLALFAYVMYNDLVRLVHS
ncbi:MAG: RIP metalloprotease RseP [Candidatus Acidiferrum sp.]